MLNYLWGFMILIGLAAGIVSGQVEAVSNASIDSAGEAVTMAVTMLGIMSMWTGLIEVARRAGLLDRLTHALKPVLSFLFPRLPKGHIVHEYLTANIIANLLGLGWAATPMGLKAMKELAGIERERLHKAAVLKEHRPFGTDRDRQGQENSDAGYGSSGRKLTEDAVKASDEMCTFLVLNISSLQLIPVSVIAYRTQYGSVNPAQVAVPGLLATMASTLVAVLFCRLMCRRGEKGQQGGGL